MRELFMHEDIGEYMSGSFETDYSAVLANSEKILARLPSIRERMEDMLSVDSPGEVTIIPVLYLEPWVGYSATLEKIDGSQVSFTTYGIKYNFREKIPQFHIMPNMFVHEYGHYFVRKALNESIPDWKRRLAKFFTPAVMELAAATVDYADLDAYFNETFTRALEAYVVYNLGDHEYARHWIETSKDFFPYMPQAANILMENFDGSGLDFYEFFPVMVDNIVPVE